MQKVFQVINVRRSTSNIMDNITDEFIYCGIKK